MKTVTITCKWEVTTVTKHRAADFMTKEALLKKHKASLRDTFFEDLDKQLKSTKQTPTY